MPCCAFAAFILGQILIGFDALKRFVLGRSASATEIAVNPATEWRLGVAAIAAPARKHSSFRWLALAASIEVALMLGAGYGLRAHHMFHDRDSVSASGILTCRSPRLARTR
jgi:hypothetical protein